MNFLPGWFPGGITGTPRRSYIGRVTSDADATSYTFNTTAIGPADSSRMVLIVASAVQGGNTGTITGVTVNGVAATAVVNATTGSSFAGNLAFFRAAVPSGTTADIVVTTSATTFTMVVDVYALYDLNSHTPFASNSATAAASGTLLATTLNIPAGGVALMATNIYISTTFTLVGLTEDVDSAFGASPETLACGSNQSMGAETARALSATAAAANDRRCLVAASWS